MRNIMYLAITATLALGACADGTGFPPDNTSTTAALKADGSGPADNCQTDYNPPDVDLGLSCVSNSDCFEVAPVLASGADAPAFCVTQFDIDEWGWDAEQLGSCVAQADLDGDGAGDVCDDDDDADGVLDDDDLCAATPVGVAFDADGCSGEQYVELTVGDCGDYANHGKYVSAVSKASKDAVNAGLLTSKERAVIVRTAAKSSCN